MLPCVGGATVAVGVADMSNCFKSLPLLSTDILEDKSYEFYKKLSSLLNLGLLEYILLFP